MNNHYDLGKLGERLAAQYLKSKHYEIIQQNRRQGHKEIDIICRFKDLVIFAEVKTTNQHSPIEPEDQLSVKKIRRLKKAALAFCLEQKIELPKTRNDLIAIKIDFKKKMANIKHYKDTF